MRIQFSTLLLTLLITLAPTGTTAEIIHKEKSLYRNIVVRETYDRRCLVFAQKRGDRNQTCMDLGNPDLLVFPYVRMTFAGLLVNPAPGKILVVGLGGGSIPGTLNALFPDASIDVVEVDEAVVRMAKQFFDFKETESLEVFVSDARVFVKRAYLKENRYDLVILDAFTGDYIPEHLMTVEFLEEVRRILTPAGVVVANTFATSRLYDHESVTYQQVFGKFLNFKMPITGNRVIIANKGDLPSPKTITERARVLAPLLDPYGVGIDQYPKFLSREKGWDESKEPLTDQYSPANLLRNE